MKNLLNRPVLNAETILRESFMMKDGFLHMELWYPRGAGNIPGFEIGLMDIRSADNIRVFYDFDRDGWVIQQAQVFSWDNEDKICDPKWKEVAFVQVWALEEEKCQNKE